MLSKNVILLLAIIGTAIFAIGIILIVIAKTQDKYYQCKNGKCVEGGNTNKNDSTCGGYCSPAPSQDKYYQCKNGKCVEGGNTNKNDSTCGGYCSQLPQWTKVQGLEGNGYCYGPRNSYPATKVISDGTINCRLECAKDSNCSSYSASDDNSVCVLYSTDTPSSGWNKPSSGWKSSLPFPTYSSPYYDCSDTKRVGCMYQNPSEVCKGDPSNNNVSCWVKHKHTSMLSSTNYDYDDDPKISSPDSLGAQVVVSNPYIPEYKLLTTKNTFYWWYLDLIKSAKKFITICNAYITLGKWQSDDPTDYQSAIYYAWKDALERGITVTWVRIPTDQTDCQNQVAKQFQYLKNHPNFTIVDWNYYNNVGCSGKNICAFFHDKIYISDKKAYIGGQNTSGSSSVDFGISFPFTSPLYQDILQKATWFTSKSKTTIKFTYTSKNPYKTTDGTEYFITVSPTWPMCTPQSNQYPKTQINDTLVPQGPYVMNTYTEKGGESRTALGIVSYERDHLINLIKNARSFLKITNFDFSVFASALSGCGWDQKLQMAFESAAKNGVDIDLWVYNTPFTDNVQYYPNPTCDLIRCPEGKAFVNKLEFYNNVHIHWWYQNPAPKPGEWSDCKVLHAKIYYSDWGLLVSSSNLTPDYFSHTSNTGLAARFTNKIPNWISTGVENTFSILKNQSNLGSQGSCDNSSPNFQLHSNDPRCSGVGNCQNTCAICGNLTSGSCGTNCTNMRNTK
ncbi:MAG: hypothetical protein GY861_03595 [bacterium]|nr:hypothetical protein [bacterium]